jgi:hypothetical protein
VQIAPRLTVPRTSGLSHRATAWIASLLVVLLLLAGAVWWLSRESTLQAAARWAVARSHGALAIDEPHGSLLSRATASRIAWQTPTRTLTFDNVALRWNPLWLLGGVIAVDGASADRATVALRPGSGGPMTPPTSLESPLRVRVAHAHVGLLEVQRAGSTTDFRDVGFTAGAGWRDWYFKLTPAQTPWGQLTADLSIGQKPPFDVDGQLHFTRKDPQPVRLAITVKGALERLGLDATLEAQTSKLVARATATPYAALPFTDVDITVSAFDPRQFIDGAPHARFDGAIRAAPVSAEQVRGDIRIVNADAGTLDRGLLPLAGVTGTLDATPQALRLGDLIVDLGAGGKLGGTASLEGTQVAMKLAGEGIDGHAIHSAIKPSRLAATLGMTGDLRSQDIEARFRRSRYDVAIAAHIGADALQLKSARATIGAGTLQASGHIGLGAGHDYALDARLSRFDPSTLGITRPAILAKPAVLNATIVARGETAPKLAVRADVRLAPSTIAGLPASGQMQWRSTGVGDARIAVKGNASVGATTLAIDGRVDDPLRLKSLDARLDLKGQDMGEMYAFLGVPVPPTRPYRIAGRLTFADQVWTFADFKGNVGRSDLAGTYAFDARGKRPAIKATLTSSRLDIVDLQGFLGHKPGEQAAHPDKALPQGEYQLDKLRSTDVDVTFTGRRFANPTLPLTDMQTHLVVRNGLATLSPLHFGAAGGKLDGWATLDARKPQITAETDLRGTDLNLNRLLPSVKAMVDSTGKVDARVRLTGRGNSLAAMLGSSNGSVTTVMAGGSMSDVVLRLANLDIANTMVALAKGNQPIPIRCVVANFQARNGTLVPDPLLIDTEHTLVTGEGRIDLARESLALRLVARPKDGSIIALRGPIDVQGPFVKPTVKPELGQAIARAGAAIALGILAGPAAILPLIDPGQPAKVDCDAYVAKARSFITEP